MKRTAPLFFLLVVPLVLACSSSRDSGIIKPEIQMVQVGDYAFTLQYQGPITISYQLAVANPSGEPITLKQIKFANIGSGAYYVRRDPHFFNAIIPPGKTLVTSFALPAYAQGGMTGSREPVTIRGIAYFESPVGKFQKVFFQNLRQDLEGHR